MQRNWGHEILLFILSAFMAGAGHAQERTGFSWVLLAAERIDPGAARATVAVPLEKSRVSAIRLHVVEGSIHLNRIVISYGNGQQHFEHSERHLRSGDQTTAIGERDEELVVEAVTIDYASDVATTPSTLQVWGLQSTESQAATKAGPNSAFRPRGRVGPGTTPKGYAEIGIYYGTTRKREGDRIKQQRSLATFSGEEAKALTLGRAVVTIPIEREIGTIPRPEFDFVVTRVALRNEDPNRDFTIAAVDVLDAETFVRGLRQQAGSATTFRGQAFVFVHGYNVGFEDAIFRTAQIAHDVGFDGPAITFSWPSRGSTWDYRHDVDTAKGARDGLQDLLTLIAQDSSIESVNVIAHSMGNDPVLEVLGKNGEIRQAGGTAANLKLREIILAAPDVSLTNFEQMALKFGGLARGVTLYASARDRAMEASKRVAGGLVRAGDVSREGPIVVRGVETIDVTDANTSFFSTNHSTFADRRYLVEDMRVLFEKSQHPPHMRFSNFKVQGNGDKQFWRYLRN